MKLGDARRRIYDAVVVSRILASIAVIATVLVTSGCGGYRHSYGLPPPRGEAARKVECPPGAPAKRGCEHADPSAKEVRFVPAERGGEWWLARRYHGYECRLPCTRHVAPYSLLEVLALDPTGEPTFNREAPPLQDVPPDVPIVVRPQLERGNQWVGGGGVLLGQLIFFSALALALNEHVGCVGAGAASRGGCTLAKVGLIGGPVVAGIGGAYWGFYYRGDDLQVSVGKSF